MSSPLRYLLAVVFAFAWSSVAVAAEPSYAPADPDVKAVVIDSSPDESFLAVQADTTGRLFVGGREALFVYEINADGSYAPRRELYRFPKDTWIYDLLIRGDDVYALTVSALYVIPNARVQRQDLAPKRLIWGVPLGHVHQCFHGMTIGPEGDIYFAMGDPLWYYGDFMRPDHWGHWTFFTQPEGTKVPYNGVGGVFRCKPDGSNFRIVARGLRNSCGLAFDRGWNLYTNDNDHESMPSSYVPGRLIHVVPNMYCSWPRGWLLSKTPDRADLVQTMFDGMGRAVPVGQAYYDDELLPAYRNNLLVARWCIRALTRYPLKPRGASFEVTEDKLLVGRDLARPVGVSVGRGGRIFTTVSYMAMNESSPIYQSDLVMLTRADDAPAAPFEAYDCVTCPPEKLWDELSHPSWSRRFVAHEELLRRGADVCRGAVQRLITVDPQDPARPHLMWLAAATGDDGAGLQLLKALSDSDPEIRRQTIRIFDEYDLGENEPGDFVPQLADADLGVQLAALETLFAAKEPIPQAVIDGPGHSDDTYLRHLATMLLAKRAPAEMLVQLSRSPDPAVRLEAVLAMGFRLTLPPAVGPPPGTVKLEALRTEADYLIEFPDGEVDLRKFGPVGNYTMADFWKQSAHTGEQEQLFILLMQRLDDENRLVRLQAANFLYMLNDARSEPQIAKLIAADEAARLVVRPSQRVEKVWAIGPFADGEQGFAAVHPPEQSAIDLNATYETPQGERSWAQFAPGRNFYNFTKQYGAFADASCYAYFRLESATKQTAQLLVGSDDGVKIWHNGRELFTNDVVRGALPAQDAILVTLQPGANDFLVRVRNTTGESGLYLMYRVLSDVAASIPDKATTASLAERLAGGGADPAALAAILNVDWAAAAKQGDAANGRKLFEAIGCAKCHAATTDAVVIGGPSLAEAGRRFTIPHLVESILAPSKQVSPVFKATTIETADGRTLTGLVTAETADKLELLQADATRVSLAKSDVESRKLVELSPMPQGVVKKPEELRDLLAFLLSAG